MRPCCSVGQDGIPVSLGFVGRDPCPAADAIVGLVGFCPLHEQPDEGARRGSGEPPHKRCANLGRLRDLWMASCGRSSIGLPTRGDRPTRRPPPLFWFLRWWILPREPLVRRCRIVIRIRHRHPRTHRRTPAFQSLVQLRCAPGIALHQILALSNIRGEIVQLQSSVLVKLDELVVVGANSPAGNAALIAVMRIMPIQRITARRARRSSSSASVAR